MSQARQDAPDDKFEVLQRKGAIPILLALLSEEKSFTELKKETGLSNGTTQRRIDDLRQVGWVEEDAVLNASGQAVKVYKLSDDVQQIIDDLRNVLSDLGIE